MKECDIFRGSNILRPLLHIFRGQDPQHQGCTPLLAVRTLGGNGFVVVDTVEQSGAVDDLVQDDGEAVDVAFLSA